MVTGQDEQTPTLFFSSVLAVREASSQVCVAITLSRITNSVLVAAVLKKQHNFSHPRTDIKYTINMSGKRAGFDTSRKPTSPSGRQCKHNWMFRKVGTFFPFSSSHYGIAAQTC